MGSKHRKKVTFRIVGGLGNQLFILAAAKFYSNQRYATVLIDRAFLNKDLSKHWVSIESFKVSENFKDTGNVLKMNQFVDRVWSYFVARSGVLNSLGQRLLGIYSSKKLGFDPNLEITSAKYIKGYFQTWKYAEKVKDELYQELELKTPSLWYLEMQGIAKMKNPIVLHVRRGDFKNEVNSYMGLLSEDYYRRAFEHLRAEGNQYPVWVFSDEHRIAREVLKFLDSEDVTWVSHPKEVSSPEEEMMLMRFGSAHVIANSTFSWWAAYLSRSTECVIAPSKWFKDIDDPEELIPPTWTRIESSWEHKQHTLDLL